MKNYVSIPKDISYDDKIVAFEKLDGSNIRAECSVKKGFYKFGTKKQMFDENTKPYNKAITLIKEKYNESLYKMLKDNKWESALFFFEFFGPSSFAGGHNFQEDMDVVLFDINPYKKAFWNLISFLRCLKVCILQRFFMKVLLQKSL